MSTRKRRRRGAPPKAMTVRDLARWARTHRLPSPDRKKRAERAAFRLLYAFLAVGMAPEVETALRDPEAHAEIRAVVTRVGMEASRLPVRFLERQLTMALTLPSRAPFYLRPAPGPGIALGEDAPPPGIDREYRKLELRKTMLLRAMDERKSRFLLKGLLAIFGADFFLDLFEPDELDFGAVIQLFLLGLWAKGALELLLRLKAILQRLWTDEKLWKRLVKRLGRFGAVRFLAGLAARMNVAVLIALVLASWLMMMREWEEEAAAYEAQLRALYDASNHPLKDDIFIANMGRIPARRE